MIPPERTATGGTSYDGRRPAEATSDEHRLAVAVEDLRLTYSDGTEAVRGVDLTIPEGEFFGFLGPNGAGKTTTIKMLATLLSPTSGRVRVNGFDATTGPRKVRESIGYMAQEIGIDPEMTAEENVRFACEAYGVPRGERDGRIAELLDLVDLVDDADKRAEEFSGGMKKRLVEKDERRLVDQCRRGVEPLFHPAGELLGALVGVVDEVDEVE